MKRPNIHKYPWEAQEYIQHLERKLESMSSYGYWIRLRERSKDEYGEKLCYCGHTDKCSCANPDKQMFRESVKRGSIILGDKDNGWEM